MTRYFYTDPLEAAYMAKRFGMAFEHEFVLCRDGGEPIDVDGPSYAECLSRHFINADSLHLLEPRVGDIVVVLPQLSDESPAIDRHKLKHIGWINQSPWVAPSGEVCEGIARVDDTPNGWLGLVRKHEYLEVIQRDEKPFFWPERE